MHSMTKVVNRSPVMLVEALLSEVELKEKKMMHVNNKSDTELGGLEGKRNPARYPPDHREPIRLQEEELRVYKKCSNESLIKAGLPFAVFFDVFRTIMNKKKGEMGPLDASSPLAKSLNMKRGIIFIGNMIFGSFLYTPVCYQRLKEFHDANEKRKLAEQAQVPSQAEGSTVKIQPEDFSYPTDIMTNLGDSDSNFSADFNASKFVLEEEEKPKVPQTTYDDLRSRNRERQNQGINKVQYPIESSSRLNTPSEPVTSSEPPPRRVKRNKYGDEME